MSTHEIVLIEDDSAIRQAIHGLLSMEGYRVHTANDGEEGLTLARRIRAPSLIILDLMLPKMSGAEFLNELSQAGIWTKTPVIVLSAGEMDRHSVPSWEKIIMIKKPADVDDLLKKIRNYCEGEKNG